MQYLNCITDIAKTAIENIPKNQIGLVSCYFGTIGAVLLLYKLKTDHEYRMSVHINN